MTAARSPEPTTKPDALTLPQHAPAEVRAWARRHFATDTINGVPTFAAGSNPWHACDRVTAAVWRAAVLYAAGLALPDPPGPFERRRCGGCWAPLRMVPTAASNGRAVIPLEVDPHLAGIAAIVPTDKGPRAHIYASVVDAQAAGGTRYRPHWGDCSHGATDPTLPSTSTRRSKR